MGVSKPQGEHCSIVTMYQVISEGANVGVDPAFGKPGGQARSTPGNWASWMNKSTPLYAGRSLVASISGILGQGSWAANPLWVNTWINQAIVISNYIGYRYNSTPGSNVNIAGSPGWMYGWWDAKGSIQGIPNNKTTECLQCIWNSFQKDPAIKKVLGQKDSWNPVDTYMVQSSVEKKIHKYCNDLLDEFNKGNVAAEEYVRTINVYLSGFVADKTLLPISLKKMTEGVSMSLKVNNVEELPNGVIDVVTGNITNIPYSYFELTGRNGKLDFRGNSFLYKASIQPGAIRHQYQIEQRMQGATGNKQEVKDIVRKDAGGYKAAGAQAGNVPVNDFKALIKEYAGVSSYDYMVPTINETLKDPGYWAGLYEEAKKYSGFKVDLGDTRILGQKFTTKEYFDILADLYSLKDDAALDSYLGSKFESYAKSNQKLKKNSLTGKIRNKLYNLRFLQALREADKKDDLCMLLTSIYYGAAKMMQKSTDLVGPFLKLS